MGAPPPQPPPDSLPILTNELLALVLNRRGVRNAAAIEFWSTTLYADMRASYPSPRSVPDTGAPARLPLLGAAVISLALVAGMLRRRRPG